MSNQKKPYLRAMSKFHRYSFGNALLILFQCPTATRVAGYSTWKKEFGRNVKPHEKGIQILAPYPSRQYVWKEVTDPNTGKVLCNPDGSAKKETQLIIGTTLVQIQAHFNADVRIFANRIYCVLSSFLLICENIMKMDTIKASSALRRKKWKKES